MNIAFDPRRRAPIASTVIALAGAMLTATTCMASADRNLAPKGVAVRIADLDIHSAAGREILLKRINDAAARVCEDYRYDRLRVQSYSNCKRESLRSALLQLGIHGEGKQ